MEQPDIIVDIKNGGVKHDDTVILSHINLTIHKGELVYLTGRVGSGKSSFLRMLYADLPLEYGTAHVAVCVKIKIDRFRLHKLVRRAYNIAYDSAKDTTLSNMGYIYWLGINTLLLTLL